MNINEDDVIHCQESDFNKLDYEEVKVHDEKNLKFYETLRDRINKWSKNRTGKFGNQVLQYIFVLPDLFILLTRLVSDKRVPTSKKVFLGAVIAYIVSPVDFIPDFIPFIGYTDDLCIAIYALDNIMNHVDQQIIYENWSGKDNIIELVQTILDKSDQLINRNILRKIRNWIWKKSK
jgi:uncharacterized membrane protein YkvA (DUF1232 family)